jgi:hypothetical protein
VTAPRQPGQVRVQEGVPWGTLLVGTASGAATLVGGVAVVVFVLYFALADGPRYRQKLLGRAGMARDRVLKVFEELQRDVEHYLLNRVILNAALGLVMTVAYAVYGLEHASIWGITTALLHFVPYVGPAVGFVLPTAMAVLQYDGSLARIGGVAAIYLVLVSVQGNLVDPIFLGKQLRLNALAVFLGSLSWFWLWGPVGALPGRPAALDHPDRLPAAAAVRGGVGAPGGVAPAARQGRQKRCSTPRAGLAGGRPNLPTSLPFRLRRAPSGTGPPPAARRRGAGMRVAPGVARWYVRARP